MERCSGCDQHQYCSNHIESKYEDYAGRLESAVRAKVSNQSALVFQVNPGPKAMGRLAVLSNEENFWTECEW